MIHEYAIQPEVLIEWAKTQRTFKMFESSFGLGTTRIISTFPTQQARRLRSYLLRVQLKDIDDLAVKRYEALVDMVTECLVVRKFDSKDIPLNEWGRLVIAENQIKPFGIILSEKPLDLEKNLTPERVDVLDELWKHPGQIEVNRTNESIYTGLKGLLELSREKITIVDPYCYTSGAVKFIGFMLNELSKVIEVGLYPEVNLFFDEDKASAAHLKAEVLKLVNFSLCDTKLKVHGARNLHNRYVLTEHGGVTLGKGVSLQVDDTQVDEIILLEKKIYLDKVTKYSE